MHTAPPFYIEKEKTKSPVKSTFTRLFFDSERGIRTLDTAGMNRML
jgi:succinate dehydrogenase flavin-adding protein (antitoxin of CptAB toxin-antitoxin module)